jgi:hypothetical protein
MNENDEYRRNAEEAQRWADKAKTEHDRAAWLRVVQGWLGLIRKRPQTGHERFDATDKAQGTGQQKSKSSH